MHGLDLLESVALLEAGEWTRVGAVNRHANGIRRPQFRAIRPLSLLGCFGFGYFAPVTECVLDCRRDASSVVRPMMHMLADCDLRPEHFSIAVHCRQPDFSMRSDAAELRCLLGPELAHNELPCRVLRAQCIGVVRCNEEVGCIGNNGVRAFCRISLKRFRRCKIETRVGDLRVVRMERLPFSLR